MNSAVIYLLTLLPLGGASAGNEAWRGSELRVVKRKPANFEELKEIALRYVGRSYVMGGVGDPSFDCSGFVCRVYAEGGYALPRVSRDQARAGVKASLSLLAPGDLLFFAPDGDRISHVGIYLGDGEMIHASSGEGQVVVADLGARWFKENLVSARRVLFTGTGTAAPQLAPIPARELVEHTGGLPITLRRPPGIGTMKFGPQLAGEGRTLIGLRSALVTERGILGVTLVPELALYLRSIALELAVAVPVRFELKQKPTVGVFERFGDYLRFIRRIAIGLRGADLELRFDRMGDLQLLSGFMVDRLTPGAEASGVAGLSVVNTPLSFFGRYSHKHFEVSALIDDVGDPSVIGTAAAVKLPFAPISVGVGYSTDQRGLLEQGGTPSARRAINAGEVDIVYESLFARRWMLKAGLSGAFSRALAGSGGGIRGQLFGGYKQRRFEIGAEFSAGYLGSRFISALFSPAYLPYRLEHASALLEAEGRPSLGGRASLRYRRVAVSAGYADTLGGGSHPIDRQLEALIELNDLPLGGLRYLDVRVAYSARAPFRSGAGNQLHTIQGGIRLRLFSWLFTEIYLAKGRNFEGGGGVTISWMP